MQPKHLKVKKLLWRLGIILLFIGSVGLLGWVQSRDPDCYLAETESQSSHFLRMCDSYIDAAPADAWWIIVVWVACIIAGIALIQLNRKK